MQLCDASLVKGRQEFCLQLEFAPKSHDKICLSGQSFQLLQFISKLIQKFYLE